MDHFNGLAQAGGATRENGNMCKTIKQMINKLFCKHEVRTIFSDVRDGDWPGAQWPMVDDIGLGYLQRSK